MTKARRVEFKLDERSLESLEKLTEQGRYPGNDKPLHFTEVAIRNPQTGEKRTVAVPWIESE